MCKCGEVRTRRHFAFSVNLSLHLSVETLIAPPPCILTALATSIKWQIVWKCHQFVLFFIPSTNKTMFDKKGLFAISLTCVRRVQWNLQGERKLVWEMEIDYESEMTSRVQVFMRSLEKSRIKNSRFHFTRLLSLKYANKARSRRGDQVLTQSISICIH